MGPANVVYLLLAYCLRLTRVLCGENLSVMPESKDGDESSALIVPSHNITVIPNEGNKSYVDSGSATSAYTFNVYTVGRSQSPMTLDVSPLTNVSELSHCRDMHIATDHKTSWSRSFMPVIDCDEDATTINSALATIEGQKLRCALFYSGTEAGCQIPEDRQLITESIPNLFTLVSSSASLHVISLLQTSLANERATIKGGPKPNDVRLWPAWVVLGVLGGAVGFVLIGGALCLSYAQRRYNNRTGDKRPGGLARAVLDSIPLVRVKASTEVAARRSQDAEREAEGGALKHGLKMATATSAPIPESSPRSLMVDRSENGIYEEIDEVPVPHPAILAAPAPTRVNTYAFSDGVRTPQRTPGLTPGFTPGFTPGITPGVSASPMRTTNEPPPKYSTDGFPFPVMPNTPLETIDEHRIVKPASIQVTTTRQEDMRALPHNRILRHLKLPNEPPTGHLKRSHQKNRMEKRQDAKPETHNSRSSIGVYVKQDEDRCAICFEDFKRGELLRALPCGHHFHKKCVDRWLLKSSTKCPICRADLSKYAGPARSSENDALHDHNQGHTFYFVKRRIKRLGDTLRSQSKPDLRRGTDAGQLKEHGDRESYGEESSREANIAPPLFRNNTMPGRLLPIYASSGHLAGAQHGPGRSYTEHTQRIRNNHAPTPKGGGALGDEQAMPKGNKHKLGDSEHGPQDSEPENEL